MITFMILEELDSCFSDYRSTRGGFRKIKLVVGTPEARSGRSLLHEHHDEPEYIISETDSNKYCMK